MKSTMHIWPQEIEKAEKTLTVSARVEWGTKAAQTLWYRLPLAYESALSPNADPFAIALLFAAMRSADRMVVHSEVSPSLLRNLMEFQAAWASWLPDQLSIVQIVAEDEREPALDHSSPLAISAFSGGVDSSYTVFRHTLASQGRHTQLLTTGLFVHGFDIPLTQAEVFERATQRAARMLHSVGMEVLPVATNFREVMAPYIRWENSFGSAIASCLLLLQGKFRIGLIPSSYSYQTLSLPYGSNPLTDPMLGNSCLSIIYDGAHQRRFGKIKALSSWPEALENLRVCWQGPQLDRNCCQCEKCIRNILTFRVVQAELPPCFSADVSDRQIRSLRLKGSALDGLRSLAFVARQQGINASWVNAVETVVRRSKRLNFLKQTIKPYLEKSPKLLRNK